MTQVERRLAVAAAPVAPPAEAPAPAPPPPPPAAQPPTEESSEDSSDRRKKEKKQKKKKKKEKRERRERERSQGQGWGVQASLGGGGKDEGEGEVLVDEGDGDGDGDGVDVVDPPNHPPTPLPQWLLKALDPRSATARKAGPFPWSAQVLEQWCAGDQPVFSSPSHSHMTIMWIFRRLIRCLIRRKEGEHRGTWGKDASKGGGLGLETPPWCPPCPHVRGNQCGPFARTEFAF